MRHHSGSFRFFILSIIFIFLSLCFGFFYLYKKQDNLLKYLELIIEQKEIAKGDNKESELLSRALSGGLKSNIWLDVQNKTKDAVVQVFTQVSRFNWLEPYKTPDQYISAGSGFFINDKGYLLTNFHIVDQASSVKIQIPSFGREQFDVDIIGVCPDRDVALLKLTDESFKEIVENLDKINYLEFGNSDVVVRTQEILALGYPLGDERLKSTLGIVSGRERAGFIQITAPLNPGSSGGPALDFAGKVVGINFAGVVEAQNVGFVIPINEIKSTVNDLYKVKLLRKPALGCIFTVATQDMIKYLKNPPGGGFFIPRIFKNMLLENIGIQEDDMLYQVNGYNLDLYGELSVPWSDDKISLLDFLNRFTVGDNIHFVIYRHGKRKDFKFKLENKFLPSIRKIYPEFEHKEVDYEVIGGMVVMPLTLNHAAFLSSRIPTMIKYLNPELQQENAVLITHVLPNSQAQKSRVLTIGAVLSEVNDIKIKTLDDFRNAVRKSKKGGFLTVKTQDKMFAAFSVDNILKEEDNLVAKYFYRKSKLLDEIN